MYTNKFKYMYPPGVPDELARLVFAAVAVFAYNIQPVVYIYIYIY
jgi:hypothetical protein